MYRYPIAELQNGGEVYVDLINSPAGHYISHKPYVINLIKEVLVPTKLVGEEIIIERDMGRVIGNSDVVPTNEKDMIFYALPLKQKVFSRYVKNHRTASPSSNLTIILAKDDAGNYEVLNTWVGEYYPPFPGDEHETAQSRDFWQNHALVTDMQGLQSKTITKNCPY